MGKQELVFFGREKALPDLPVIGQILHVSGRTGWKLSQRTAAGQRDETMKKCGAVAVEYPGEGG
jgi:hypothetical protein